MPEAKGKGESASRKAVFQRTGAPGNIRSPADGSALNAVAVVQVPQAEERVLRKREMEALEGRKYRSWKRESEQWRK